MKKIIADVLVFGVGVGVVGGISGLGGGEGGCRDRGRAQMLSRKPSVGWLRRCSGASRASLLAQKSIINSKDESRCFLGGFSIFHFFNKKGKSLASCHTVERVRHTDSDFS